MLLELMKVGLKSMMNGSLSSAQKFLHGALKLAEFKKKIHNVMMNLIILWFNNKNNWKHLLFHVKMNVYHLFI